LCVFFEKNSPLSIWRMLQSYFQNWFLETAPTSKDLSPAFTAIYQLFPFLDIFATLANCFVLIFIAVAIQTPP
jgi:hypothetical protein